MTVTRRIRFRLRSRCMTAEARSGRWFMGCLLLFPRASRRSCVPGPASSTRRAGRPSPVSQAGAAPPRMIAAVLAMLASVQVAAATETVRQTGAAGSPVRGSRMWCSTSPPRRQRRAAVLEVARPPRADGDDRGRPGGRVLGAAADVLHPDPPAAVRGLAAHRDVPAQADQDAAAECGGDAGGRPVGRPGLGGGAQVQPDPGRDPEQPGLLVELHLAPAGDGPDGQPAPPGPSRWTREKSRS